MSLARRCARRVALLQLLAVSACGAASLRGADVLDSDSASANPHAELVPVDCRDGGGRPIDPPPIRVERAVLADGSEVAIERRAGYDSVFVHNAYDESGARVFEYVSDDGRNKVLHVFRLPPLLPGARLVLADAFETRDGPHGFRATIRHLAESCALVAADAPASLTQERATGSR
jgi:hypothetical protein